MPTDDEILGPLLRARDQTKQVATATKQVVAEVHTLAETVKSQPDTASTPRRRVKLEVPPGSSGRLSVKVGPAANRTTTRSSGPGIEFDPDQTVPATAERVRRVFADLASHLPITIGQNRGDSQIDDLVEKADDDKVRVGDVLYRVILSTFYELFRQVEYIGPGRLSDEFRKKVRDTVRGDIMPAVCQNGRWDHVRTATLLPTIARRLADEYEPEETVAKPAEEPQTETAANETETTSPADPEDNLDDTEAYVKRLLAEFLFGNANLVHDLNADLVTGAIQAVADEGLEVEDDIDLEDHEKPLRNFVYNLAINSAKELSKNLVSYITTERSERLTAKQGVAAAATMLSVAKSLLGHGANLTNFRPFVESAIERGDLREAFA